MKQTQPPQYTDSYTTDNQIDTNVMMSLITKTIYLFITCFVFNDRSSQSWLLCNIIVNCCYCYVLACFLAKILKNQLQTVILIINSMCLNHPHELSSLFYDYMLMLHATFTKIHLQLKLISSFHFPVLGICHCHHSWKTL